MIEAHGNGSSIDNLIVKMDKEILEFVYNTNELRMEEDIEEQLIESPLTVDVNELFSPMYSYHLLLTIFLNFSTFFFNNYLSL